jgi:ribosomal subunit interface protein
MKIHYTGRSNELTPAQQRKIEAKFAKLARLLDMKQGEREAHVMLRPERHLHHAEITVRFHDRNLVSEASGGDDFLAMHEALEKLERQVQKLRTKWRDAKRSPRAEWTSGQEQEAAAAEAAAGSEEEILGATDRPSDGRP